ncbi:MAG: 50S ribosomal protein L3 [Nannocystaceae bacterium]
MNLQMGILAKKLGMTEYYEADGTRVPVTVLGATGNVVTGHRTEDRDGYTAIQLGFEEKKASRVNKPDLGQFKAANTAPRKLVRELRVPAGKLADHPVGSEIALSIFEEGSVVDVSGTSKGKGFQGVIKRHNMRGEKRTHGQHEVYRHGGSIGCRLTPGRVLPGKRMPGQMGNAQVTVQNLKVTKVMGDEGVLLVRGAIPGPRNGYVVIRHAVKAAARVAAKSK